MPIAELLTLLPVSFKSNKDRERLLNRGNGRFDFNNGTFVNSSSQTTDVVFDDYMLGAIAATLPASVGFSVGSPGDLIDLQALNPRIQITSIDNLYLPGESSVAAPFSVESFQVGSASMLTRMRDSRGTDITIDGRIRSSLNVLAGGGLDDICEKDWVLLQDDSSKRCIIQRNYVPTRQYPVVGSYDSKDEAVKASHSKGCNGLTITG